MNVNMVYPPRPARRGRVIALHCSGGGASQWSLPGRGAGRPLRGAGAGALRLREHRTMDRRARLHARRRGRASHRADRPRVTTRFTSSGTPTAAASRSTWRWPGRTASPAWRSTSRRRFICCARWASGARSPTPRSPASPGTSARASSPATIGERLPAFVDYWNGPGSWNALRPSVQSALIRWAPKGPLDFRALIDDPTPADAYRRADVSRAHPARRACAVADPRDRRRPGGAAAGEPARRSSPVPATWAR